MTNKDKSQLAQENKEAFLRGAKYATHFLLTATEPDCIFCDYYDECNKPNNCEQLLFTKLKEKIDE